MLARPNPVGLDFDDISHPPTLIDPRQYQAIRIVVRHTMPVAGIGGWWLHRSNRYDERPWFDLQPAEGDGQWHEGTLRLSDSPFVDWSDDVVFGLRRPDGSTRAEETARALRQMALDVYLDIDRIELVALHEQLPAPTIESIEPTRARKGAEVTIHGSGFALPPERNLVAFRGDQLEIVGGDQEHLIVRVQRGGIGPLTVRSPGGKRAESPQPYTSIGSAEAIERVSGDGQVVVAGSRLQPMVVRITDGATGVPEEPVRFSVASGGGVLSVTETATDADGFASTVLTAGLRPGVVRVRVDGHALDTIVFAATVLPN